MTKGWEEKRLSLLDRAFARVKLDRVRSFLSRDWLLLERVQSRLLKVCVCLGGFGGRSYEVLGEMKVLALGKGRNVEEGFVIRMHYECRRRTLFR